MQKTAKERIREWVMLYLEDRREELEYDSIEELISSRLWTYFYRDDVEYEINDMLESDYLDWLCLSTNTIWTDSDPYVIVFWRIDYKHNSSRIIVNNSRDVDDFVFDSVDDIVDWIDEMYWEFITIQEELKQHFIS